MATTVTRGLAIINAIVGGVPTNISVWANGISPQSSSVTQGWKEENVMDAGGFENASLARDHAYTRQMEFKPTSTTLAQAKGATIFLAPFAKLTFSGSEASDFDGDWRLENGAQIQLKNDQTASVTVPCKRWADGTQNTLLNTVPA